MAESFSVKAILSAYDKGYTQAMKNAEKATQSLGDRIKGGFAFGVLASAGAKAFSVISDGARNLVTEIDSSNAAWKTFEGNMSMLGKSRKEINSTKKELQKFAEQTIYSSSDMATTYSQLAAVGTKNCTKLVKGFGGLAAAAENPTQAMKTLSMQATQMAAKPKVAWEDFKLMLEQTPAGIAAVAKEMGMSTQEMVKNVQDGKVSTEEFFDAIAKVGTSDSFTKLATQYKTVGQAMDGLQETIGNKLTPAFDVLSSVGISAVSKLVDKMGELDGEKIAQKLTSGLDKIKPYWDILSGAAVEVGKAFGDAFSAIGDKVAELNGKFGSTQNIENFGSAIDVASGALKGFAGFLEDHADIVATLIDHLPQLVGAYLAFKAVKAVAPGVMTFTKAITSLTGKSFSGLAGKLFNTSKGQEAVGQSSKATSKQILTSAKAFMMLGAGVALVSAGFYLLAQAAVTLSESGGLAIGIFAGMAVAVTALSLGLMAMLTNIQSTPKQMETLGNSFLKVSAGIAVMVGSLAALALALTPLASLGTTAVPPLLAFGAVVAGLAVVFATFGQSLKTNMAGIAAFAASVSLLAVAMAPIASTGTEGAVAMAAFGVVVAGLVVVFATFGSALNVAIPGMLALGAAAVLVGEGLNLASGFVKAAIPLVKQLGETFTKLSDGVAKVVDAISGGFAKVLDSIAGIIESIGTSAKNAGIGFESVASGIKKISGLSIGSIVKSLGAVGTGLSTISTKGKDLPTVAAGMTVLVTALTAATANITMFNAGMQTLSTMMTTLPANINMLKASFANFTITPPNVEPLVAAFTRVKTSSQGLVTAFAGLGAAAMMASVQVGASSGGILMLSAVMITAAAGASAMSARLKSARSGLTAISSGANKARGSLASLQASFRTTTSGLGTIGPKATSAMNQLTTAFKNAANKAKSAGKQIGTDFTKTMQAGLKKAPSVASKQVNSVISKLRAGRSKAYSAGAYISKGFAQGMLSCMGTIESAARRMAAAADKAVRAKAKIHSPSKVSEKSGGYWGQGWVNGILSKVRAAKAAAQELVSIPALSIPKVSFAYAGEMSADYDYYHNRVYVIEVPVEIEGKEVARASAKYTKEKLDKLQARDDRKHGRV
ncbi:MAG TPA: tape measure protein [Candidatus Anaerostipes avistercoris]|uniref:Tape measure protein n=1 Tax=Candidatus Anaerostipes avistercoris TaxID=2838462 RepID=A0A9D2PFR1_9FIRM|nr:tape measure protein [Candidatus Anaerostipes avistercoris]